MGTEDKLEEIRKEIAKLQKARESAILEKGLSAQFNNDLRENAQYDYWVDQEYYYTFKIKSLLETANSLQKKKADAAKKPRRKSVVSKTVDDSLSKKHKWL